MQEIVTQTKRRRAEDPLYADIIAQHKKGRKMTEIKFAKQNRDEAGRTKTGVDMMTISIGTGKTLSTFCLSLRSI